MNAEPRAAHEIFVNTIYQLFNSRCVIVAIVTLTTVLWRADGTTLRAGEFTWNPEFSASGPLVIIISLREQTLSAYRNGIRIARSSVSSGRKGRSTPAGVFTILEKEVTHYSNKYHHAPMPYMQP